MTERAKRAAGVLKERGWGSLNGRDITDLEAAIAAAVDGVADRLRGCETCANANVLATRDPCASCIIGCANGWANWTPIASPAKTGGVA